MNKLDTYKVVQTSSETKIELAKQLFSSIASYFRTYSVVGVPHAKRMENIIRGQLLCESCRQTLDFIAEQTPAIITLQTLLTVALEESTKKLKGEDNKLDQVIELLEMVASYDYNNKIG